MRAGTVPSVCPDLNPAEGAGGWVKYRDLANFCPRDLRHLESAAAKSLTRLAENHLLLQNLTRNAGLIVTAEPERALAARRGVNKW